MNTTYTYWKTPKGAVLVHSRVIDESGVVVGVVGGEVPTDSVEIDRNEVVKQLAADLVRSRGKHERVQANRASIVAIERETLQEALQALVDSGIPKNVAYLLIHVPPEHVPSAYAPPAGYSDHLIRTYGLTSEEAATVLLAVGD